MPGKKASPRSRQLYGGRLSSSLLPAPVPEKQTKRPGMAMSVEEMADELAIGRNVAYELVQRPDFPSFMIGRRVLVSRKGLQEWIDAQCKKGPGTTVITEAPEP